MPFKGIKVLFLMTATTAILGLFVGCSYFFDEKGKETEINYEEQVGSCIGRVNETIGFYFSSDKPEIISEKSLDDFGVCYNDSLASFIQHTKSGRLESDDYSAENIELLVHKFHPEVNVNTERIRGYIRLKAFLIGGDSETISKKELLTIQELLPIIVDAFKNLNAHRDIWMRMRPLSRNQKDYEMFNESFDILKKQIGNILAALDEFSGNREIELHEVLPFLISEIFPDTSEEKAKFLPLVIAFKNFVVFEEGGRLHRNNFTLLMRQAVLTYEALTKFKYFIREKGVDKIFTNIGHLASFVTRIPSQLVDSSMFKGVGLQSLYDVFNLSESILTYSLRSRPNEKLEMETLREVLLALEQAEIMNGPLTAETLSFFLSRFSERWLDPGSPVDPTLTLNKVGYLEKLISRWFKKQQTVNTLFDDPAISSVSLLNFEISLPEQKVLRQWVEIFKNGKNNMRVNTHQWDERNRVIYSNDIKNFTYNELTVSNSISMLVEIFMKPFNVNENDPLKFRINDQQAQDIYEVIRILGVEMAFMDSRIDDSGFRSFGETNNFSTQKRSDAWMDFYEGYEYLSVAMSAGRLADGIYNNILKTPSCELDDYGVHGRKVIDAQCVRNFLRANFLDYFGHLSTIANYWRNADSTEKDSFIEVLELSSRAGLIREKHYDLSEIRVTVSILSYLEAIFFMFDQENRNGLADGIESSTGSSELRRAETHFRPMIRDFLVNKAPSILIDNEERFQSHCDDNLKDDIKLSQEEIIKCVAPKIFIHLLTRGSLPIDKSDKISRIQFWWLLRSQRNEDKAFEGARANPQDVLKVFSALAKITLDSHRDKIRQFLLAKHDKLYESLRADKAPECRQRSESVFCEFSREMFCNENVMPKVFEDFSDRKVTLFPRKRFKQDPEESVKETMLQITRMFHRHEKFSNFCLYPPTSEVDD